MQVKICGITEERNLEQILLHQPDLVGFIFYAGSKRYVRGDNPVLEVPTGATKRVGVFVNESNEQILSLVASARLHAVQLHGSESATQVAALRNKAEALLILKAFGISDIASLKQIEEYAGLVDFFLFDTADPSHGGTGRSFNWELLNHYTGETPFFLSGGLGIENLESVPKHAALCGVDLNSRLESQPGLKDIKLVAAAIQQARGESKNDH